MPRCTAFLLILSIILHFHLSLGEVHGIRDDVKPQHPFHKMNTRKLMVEVTLDYDYGGPNPRHDKRGKPPGGKNP
ncbi:uncharacterized protein LOC143847489 [Tasmannia lanceolata]|uniref:uncharacterized protein LOC143847489 n=1 Tax=Tasmannia lanceolata TaxID=3420 RepID=UPI004063D75D